VEFKMSDSLHITSVSVKGLFNQYDHHIDFNQEERITILHGINGVGKTTLLRMINNVFTQRFYYFKDIPFIDFVINLSNNQTLELKKRQNKNNIEAFLNGKKLNIHNFDIDELIKSIRWISKLDDSTYYDRRFEETLSLEEVIERCENHDSSEVLSEQPENSPTFANIPIQFIEASRLLCTKKPQEPHRSRELITHTHTVERYASELKKHISSVMVEYGKKTQELEQTFPFRLLEVSEHYTYEQLKEHIQSLQEKRIELREVGLLPKTDLPPMERESIDDLEQHHATVMNLYVKDSEEKLKILEPLSKKIKLLLKIINGKFQGKQLRIDEQKGLVIVGKDGEIDLKLLSSGEQHELVMFYDLIFKVEPNTLIMIDEPELSLHITWQNKFIDELKEIVKQEKFDVLIATHSPTIVGNNSHLMVALGDNG